MATGMNEKTFHYKSKMLNEMGEEFKDQVDDYIEDVKTTMYSAATATAIHCFETCLLFLTQVFPRQTSSAGFASGNHDESDLRSEIDRLKKKNEKLTQSNRLLKAKVAELNKKVINGEALMAGMRKLQKLYKAATCAASTSIGSISSTVLATTSVPRMSIGSISSTVRATTSVPRMSLGSISSTVLATTSAPRTFGTHISSPTTPIPLNPPTVSGSAAASASDPRHRSIDRLSVKSTFSCGTAEDGKVPYILDVKLLSEDLIILADYHNRCLKQFDIKGNCLHRQNLLRGPAALTMMKPTSEHNLNVAVTLPKIQNIKMFAVKPGDISLVEPILKDMKYWSIAAIDENSFAVGNGAGIDIIDHSGEVKRSKISSIEPFRMVATPDGCLVMSTYAGGKAKLRLEDGGNVYQGRDEVVQNCRGIACLEDSSCIVVDDTTSSLHLISPTGQHVKRLWARPDGGGSSPLHTLAATNEIAVCVSTDGTVYVLDICYSFC